MNAPTEARAAAAEVFGLYLVVTDPVAGYEACAEAAVSEGLRYLQLRMKDRPRAEVLAAARGMASITRGSGTRFIVNDDVLIAAEADADGVHLGQGDMPLAEARRLWPAPGKVFGLSTHDEAQESRAPAQEPDYIGVGPLFATPTKKIPDPVLGVVRAARIIAGSRLTCVAIGGIDDIRLREVLAAGIPNFAILRYVCRSPAPRERIRRLMDLWRERSSSRSSAPAGERG